jgi:inosine-uridine nucleoside N-ribohydrolase
LIVDGVDGLGGIHDSHPHFTPEGAWDHLFEAENEHNIYRDSSFATNFIPSRLPAHKDMLRVLRENEELSITIVAVGPLTNLALAIEEDPETFLRAKEVVCMGGAVSLPGNITPVAEFNLCADAYAAAKVFAMTSAQPTSTMPPQPLSAAFMAVLMTKKRFSRELKLTLFPLDITISHVLKRSAFKSLMDPLVAAQSPLAKWADVFLSATFDKIAAQSSAAEDVSLNMHDPLNVWYVLRYNTGETIENRTPWSFTGMLDIRIEALGQWTRGMCVLDRRQENDAKAQDIARRSGNNIRVCETTGWEADFGIEMLKKIFVSD